MGAARDQWVVVYDRADATTCVYTTGYDEAQLRRGVVACVDRYGTSANVRSAPAEDHPPPKA